MPAKTSSPLIPIALIVVVIMVAFYVFNQQQTPEPIPKAPVQEEQEVVATMPDIPEQDIQTGDESSIVERDRGIARRIKANQPRTNKPYPKDTVKTKPDTDWENEFEAENSIEAALAGDIDNAIEITELVGFCRAGYENEQRVQSELSRFSKSVAQGGAVPSPFSPGIGQKLQFKNFAEYEQFTWNRFAQCQASSGKFNQALRERLTQLAEAGNVNARYLYAMWIPNLGSSSSDDLINWMTYQSNAMEFTWRNIREGEPLGLLAYGRSLEQSGHIYFTPRHMRYGPAFILAAYKCGLDNFTVNQKVNNMTGNWKQRNMIQPANQAETLSDKIANTFCL